MHIIYKNYYERQRTVLLASACWRLRGFQTICFPEECPNAHFCRGVNGMCIALTLLGGTGGVIEPRKIPWSSCMHKPTMHMHTHASTSEFFLGRRIRKNVGRGSSTPRENALLLSHTMHGRPIFFFSQPQVHFLLWEVWYIKSHP